jgi:MarR family transcriptional regulator, organic hydroperoxide resistance regulator
MQLPVHEDAEQASLRTWVQLARTYLLVQRRIVRALAEHDITLAQFDVLATLHHSEGLTQQDLAEWLLVTKGNICGLLDRLERAGWVSRRADARDGRTNRLHLTPDGRAKVREVLPEHDALVVRTLSVLDARERVQLREMLRRLEQAD